MSFLAELWAYMGARKKFWLLPLLLVLLVMGGLIVLSRERHAPLIIRCLGISARGASV
jgi:hypothetical protein